LTVFGRSFQPGETGKLWDWNTLAATQLPAKWPHESALHLAIMQKMSLKKLLSCLVDLSLDRWFCSKPCFDLVSQMRNWKMDEK